MPIALDVAIAAGFATSAATVSAPDVTVGSGANRYVYAGFASRDFTSAAAHNSVELEAEALSQLGTTQTWFFGLGEISAWGRTAPGSGASRTLTATAAATQNDVGVCGVVYTGVDQGTPTRDVDQNQESGTAASVSPSLTLTTVAGDRVVMVCVLQLETPDTVTTSGETQRVETVGGDLTLLIVDKEASGTSTTISPTFTFDAGSNNYRVAYHAVAIIPAADNSQGKAARLLLAA